MAVAADTTTDLDRILASAAHFLPAQGPIDVFIHHNTLHAFEDRPFEEAVVEASRLLGTEPFLSESRYRDELARGRIRMADIDAVLAAEEAGRPPTILAEGRVPLVELHRALLLHAVREESDAAVRWTLTESDAIERLRPDLAPDIRRRIVTAGGGAAAHGPDRLSDIDDDSARRTIVARADASRLDEERRACSELWHACVEAAAMARPGVRSMTLPVRHRDLILAVEPTLDTDALVHPLLIRLCAAYLDQGVASWVMPDRQLGLLESAARLYSGRFGPTAPWSGWLGSAMREVRGMTAEACVERELGILGVPRSEWPAFVTESLLALRGWAGMIVQFEERPDRAPVEAVPARLADFLALRLVCDRVATEHVARRMGHRTNGDGPGLQGFRNELRERHPTRRGPGTLARAFRLHQVAQLVGLAAGDIRALDENEILRLESEIGSFDSTTRRRLFHLAYERRHRIEVLDALAANGAAAFPPSAVAPARPAVQWVLCIDERCESFRRHLEELGAAHETFGTAGFFGVPMYYRGLDDWHASPLCPIVMRPRHTVLELPLEDAAGLHAFRRSVRRRVGQLSGSLSAGSRTVLRGGIFTPVIGALAAVPLVARVAFPRLAARIGQSATALGRRRIGTRLALERHDAAGSVAGTQAGFDVDEMVSSVRRVLEDIGLTSGFARLVAILGHGSSSRNNPHESAYDCGACGGGRGGPNARAFAMMANDPRVRARLASGGLVIPADTWFIGGMLDTCASLLTWHDLDLVPAGHAADVTGLLEAGERVATADAHERCRRFETAPRSMTAVEARAHVEARSVDLAQVRPELGHATNAVCIVGRRHRTRGLFLDRRSFLVSYDPTPDADGTILARTLAAVGPVGAGINLEYYFSLVDRLGYGAGTKLPHNITGLIGVMDGHGSDLRTGLPWQMVEIHEPVRLLMVIEADPDTILRAAESLPAVKRMVVNRWIQLVSWHPLTGALAVFERGTFVPYVPERRDLPVVDRSILWYAGHRDHLPPARVLAAAVPWRTGPGDPA
ncbi:MAG: DUF2309 domain-containing protein [Planctomycetia bacterium]